VNFLEVGALYPSSWSKRRLRFAARMNPSKREATGRSAETEVSFVPMEAVGTWGGVDTSAKRAIGEVSSGYTFFREGDVLVAKITPCFENGKGGIAERLESGIGFGTTELHVLRPSRELDNRFLFYITISHPFRVIGEGEMFGAGGQKRVPERFILDYPLGLPEVQVQRSIATFLDRRTAAIDALIAKKERMIELLQEKRQALITQAVTKGLGPSVPMKESGIEWVGKVPAHWKILPIKRTAHPGRWTFTDGDWIETPFITEEGVRLIQTGNVGIGRYKEQGFRYVSEATFRELGCTEVSPGDVLICRLDGPVGRACLAPSLGVPMITSVDNVILKPRSDCDARYLVYVLSSPKYIDWVQVLCRVGGGFRFRVSRTMLGDIQIPAPPFDEQRRVADLLDQQTAYLTTLEEKLDLHCERLREYRQALITAAVTGKIDVSKKPV
jgi:type I restriction enzyme, S subunit